jgi:hypothetical protein
MKGAVQPMYLTLRNVATSLLVLAVAAVGAAADDDPSAPVTGPAKEADVRVRPLQVKREWLPPASAKNTVHGLSRIKVLRSAAELTELVGKKAGDQLAGQVDFANDDVILVSWVGSDRSRLTFRVVATRKERAVEFFLKEPPGDSKPQLLVGVLGADFFAVPRGTPVRLALPGKGDKAGAGRPDGVPSRAPDDPVIGPEEPAIPPPARP